MAANHLDGTPFMDTGLPTYSIKKEFAGATVMITGASGYIGSLLVEQLLRTTDVKRILVLIRGKRGCTAQERLQRMLYSGLFHLVRDDARLLAKVELLEGDMNSDDLGLSQADLDTVINDVQFVVHSAASIELEADVQHTLRSNYMGTRRLLALAMGMQSLRCFLHVSTAYVNVNRPKGSSVEEAIYPLFIGQQRIKHAEIVEDLMSLNPAAANVRAQMYMDMWDFPNSYTMGKNLTEQLVATYHRDGLPVAIVRPSLVCGLSGPPYPGYCGNLAGPIGMGVAMAVGLFDCLQSIAMVPTHVWDAVPGDVVSSVILAAAAATAAQIDINQYKDSTIASPDDPLVVHAGTSTTYPISFAEASHAGNEFVRQNPPPFRLPGGQLFNVPLDYRPDEKAVARCKYWTAWKVWAAVGLLEMLGQHKTARRLKYGHMAWEIQNSTKTDRNMFFGSKNLRQLEAQLDGVDLESRHYIITWTIKNGGWPRYIATNIAGMYRIVFGISDVKGLEQNDFKFIPAKSVRLAKLPGTTGASAARKEETQPLNGAAPAALQDIPEGEEEETGQPDVITASLRGTAAAFSTIPASGSQVVLDEGAGARDSPMPGGRAVARSVSSRFPATKSASADNARGIRQAISLRLGNSLSYKAAAVDDAAGVVQGGALYGLSKPSPRASAKAATPTGSVH